MLLPRKRKIGRTHFDFAERRIILFGVLFLFGVATGAFTAAKTDTKGAELLRGIAESYVHLIGNKNASEIYVTMLIPPILLLAAAFVCAADYRMRPVIYLLPVLHGMGFGVFCVAMWLKYSGTAVKLIAITLFPHEISTVFVLFLAYGELTYCRNLYDFGNSAADAAQQRKLCAVMLLFMLIIMLCCAVSAYIANVFRVGVIIGQ